MMGVFEAIGGGEGGEVISSSQDEKSYDLFNQIMLNTLQITFPA